MCLLGIGVRAMLLTRISTRKRRAQKIGASNEIQTDKSIKQIQIIRERFLQHLMLDLPHQPREQTRRRNRKTPL